jgi:hypothetical protein
MKKYVLLFIHLVFGSIAVFAQDIAASQVPSVVINQFNTDFPKAKDVEWEQKSNGYKVDFERGWNKDFKVWYAADGKQLKSVEDLTKNELPKSILTAINKDYKNYHIDDAEKITEDKKVSYKVELEYKNDEKIIYFNEQGLPIK